MKQEETTLEYKLLSFLNVAEERCDLQIKNILKTTTDILNEFPKLNENQFRKALRNGGLGKYGRSYKLSTQEVCFWIREYVKENKNNLGV